MVSDERVDARDIKFKGQIKAVTRGRKNLGTPVYCSSA